MQRGRFDIQDPFLAVGGLAACYFHDKSKGIAFIQQTQFALWFGQTVAGYMKMPPLIRLR